MSSTRVLFLVIGFGNSEEVRGFLRQLNNREDKAFFAVDVVVVVNRGEIGDFRSGSEGLPNIRVQVVDPEKNLGYLPGCEFGLLEYLRTESLPDWIAVSNTDLTLPSNLLSLLVGQESGVGQLSPLVVDASGGVQNPHLLRRPSRLRMRCLDLLHRFSPVGALYILASALRSRREHPMTSFPPRLKIYSAHGSIFFLSRAFFESGGSFDDAPMLYSEELFIGEQLRLLGLTSVCVSRFRVVHAAHAQTGLLGARQKSRLTGVANRRIFERFFKNEPSERL